MRLALAVQTPDVTLPLPVALLSGSWAEKVQKAARLGVDGLELMTADPSQVDARRLRAEMEANGLLAVAVGSGAAAMQAGLYLLHADPGISDRACRRLEELVDFAAAGVRLAIEPLNRYEADLVNTAAEGLALIDSIGHPALGLLLDTYHVNIEEASWDAPVRLLQQAGKLWHVHLGDNNRLPPGEGMIDFVALVRTLRSLGYSSALSAELLARPDPDTAARRTVEHMRPLLEAAGCA